MVSVCLPSDALLQHLPSYVGFSYLGRGVSLHGCSSKVQLLLRTLDEGYLLMSAPPDFECGVAPLDPPLPTQPPLLGHGVAPSAKPIAERQTSFVGIWQGKVSKLEVCSPSRLPLGHGVLCDITQSATERSYPKSEVRGL